MTERPEETSNLIELITRLKAAEVDWDGENIADVLWLSRFVEGDVIHRPAPKRPKQDLDQEDPPPTGDEHEGERDEDPKPLSPPSAGNASLSMPQSQEQERSAERERSKGIPFKTPVPPALRRTLALGRSLRPLMRRVDSYRRTTLDEAATAELSAEQQFCITVERPERERWLELALVVEVSGFSFLWEDTVRDFRQVLERQGAFRAIQVWYLQTQDPNNIQLLAQRPKEGEKQQARSAKELLDASGRRLILVVSDCISAAWQQESLHQQYLEAWAAHGPVALVQLLPGNLWQRTVLRDGLESRFSAWLPGVPNRQLFLQEVPLEKAGDVQPGDVPLGLKLPVITMEPNSLGRWAKMLVGGGEHSSIGVWFDEGWRSFIEETAAYGDVLHSSLSESETSNAQQRGAERIIDRFFATASPLAQDLAILMSLAPVSLPVIYLIQETMLPDSQPLHLAEVFMSGLMERVDPGQGEDDSANVYDFRPSVREGLLQSVTKSEADRVLAQVSEYIGERIGRSIYSVTALLQLERELGEEAEIDFRKFAEVTRQVLRQMGGDYAALLNQEEDNNGDNESQQIEWPPLQELTFETGVFVEAVVSSDWPPFLTEEFTVATAVLEDAVEESLEAFSFETATIAQEAGEWVIQRQQGTAYRRIELLPNDVELEMVQIPAGSFVMGSPEAELERQSTEGPQHEVTIAESFQIGRYPVTQAQWQVVARMEKIERDLESSPSHFKGDHLPVEQVSWYDAVEFCRRLSRYTQREYRLPSEAEWEYVCRAGTTTPFFFGETLSTELANYNGSSYGNGPKGRKRRQATVVGSFPANAWGLHDMHGNVLEWCQDVWHENYEKAPTHGSAWLEGGDQKLRVRRGGSCYNFPGYCRSAYRYRLNPDNRSNNYGFRVVCVAPRTG